MEYAKFIEFISIPYESIKNSVNNKQRIIQIKPKIRIKGIRFIKENK
jgi:hypothetical protein